MTGKFGRYSTWIRYTGGIYIAPLKKTKLMPAFTITPILRGTQERKHVLIRYTYRRKVTFFHTGITLPKEEWSEKKATAKDQETSEAIAVVENNIRQVAIQLIKAGAEPMSNLVKRQYLRDSGQRPDKGLKNNFRDAVRRWLSLSKDKADNTVRNYMAAVAKVKEYCEEQGIVPHLEMFDMNFHKRFIQWAYAKGYKTNTVGGWIKNIKVLMKDAYTNDFTQSTIFKNPDFVVPEDKETDFLWHSRDDLDKIMRFPLIGALARARDVHVFQCLTSLRYSDIREFKPENIKGNRYYKRTVKTKEKQFIPLSELAKAILLKYDYKLPIISNAKQNNYVKAAFEKAGFDDEVTLVTYSGPARIETKGKYYEFISTHTARRTFVILSLEMGMSEEMLRKITGHRSYQAFKRYVRIADEGVDDAIKVWDQMVGG